MLFHRSLNEVFRSWTHIAVLRALQNTAVGSTGNQVARDAQMHPRSAFKALTALEVLGIVDRRRGGRDHLFTLNRDHVLLESGILPMLDVERRMIERLEAELQRLLRRRVIAAILFGSVARHEEKPESDLDICCIVDGDRNKGMAQDALHAGAPVIYRRFGAKLAPIFFTAAEFQLKRRSPLVKAMLAEGRVIVGRIPGAQTHG